MPMKSKRARQSRKAAKTRWSLNTTKSDDNNSTDIDMLETIEKSDPKTYFSDESESTEDESESDIITYEYADNISENVTNYLKWEEGSDSYLPGIRGMSVRNIRRKNKKLRDICNEAKSMKPITHYFGGSTIHIKEKEHIMDFDEERLDFVFKEKDSCLKKMPNDRIASKELKHTKLADINRLIAVGSYLRLLKSGMLKMEASELISKQIGKGSYGARLIRKWASFYFENLSLPFLFQGKHPKTTSLIHDEDVKLQCIQFLKMLKPKDRNFDNFKIFVHQTLFPAVTGAKRKKEFHDSTLYRWLHLCGFHYSLSKKGTFVDGHERDDVKEHRKKFIRQILSVIHRTDQFLGEDLSLELPLLNSEEKKLVLVWHDESCFSAYDGASYFWLQEGEKVLKKKGNGKSIMVSGFLCQCHGLYSHQLIIPGKNDEGWWSCEDLIKQAKESALPDFERLHPNCDGLFIFDNSMNHKKKPSTGLFADGLPLKDGGKNVPSNIRPGWFIDDNNNRVEQNMYNDDKKAKGLLTILRERGILHADKKIKRLCTEKCVSESPFNCCAVNILNNQPDFQEQKSMLEEFFGESRFEMLLLPKFHPEFNPIENVWGECKRYTRERCDYSFSGLKRIVPEALKSVCLIKVKKFQRRAIRLMTAYERGLSPQLAEFATKVFKGHRMIPPETLIKELEENYEEKHGIIH
jgi:hypothetical protein